MKQLNLFETEMEKIKGEMTTTDRVKDIEESEKHICQSLQASINSLYQTNFLNSGNIKALRMAISREKLCNLEGYSVHGYITKDGRLLRVEVKKEEIVTNTNSISDMFKSFLETFGNADFVSTDLILTHMRGSRYKEGKYVYNKKLKKFGKVIGYFINNDKSTARFKIKLCSAHYEGTDLCITVSQTDWNDGDNLKVFNTDKELKRYIKSLHLYAPINEIEIASLDK